MVEAGSRQLSITNGGDSEGSKFDTPLVSLE